MRAADDGEIGSWERAAPREDPHGLVSEWRSDGLGSRPTKRPGERRLAGSARFYDFATACRIARRDGWECPGGQRPGETARAYAARAAEGDFRRLGAWMLRKASRDLDVAAQALARRVDAQDRLRTAIERERRQALPAACRLQVRIDRLRAGLTTEQRP